MQQETQEQNIVIVSEKRNDVLMADFDATYDSYIEQLDREFQENSWKA